MKTPLAAAAILVALAVASPAPAADGPRAAISATANQALEILKDKSVDTAGRRKRLEDLAGARFDFDTMSRLVLARNWAQLSPAQQQQFVEEFKRHLSVTYGRNIDNYSNEIVEVGADREEARGDWTVKTKIVRGGGNADVLVDYRVRKIGDEWKIIDVTIEGISLIANFRSQFQEIVASDGVDHLLALLHEKNAAGESLLPPDKVSPSAGGGSGDAGGSGSAASGGS